MALFRTTLLCLLMSAGTAAAQEMHRCLRADGSVVYTDRLCEPEQTEKPTASAAHATPQLPLRSGRTGLSPPPSCSKNPDDLLYSVRSAIDMKDINQLVKSYHWVGVSQEQSESLLARLDAMVDRPLLDVQLLYQEPRADMLSDLSAEEVSDDSAPASRESTRTSPQALKVMQYQSTTSTETVSTVFRLQRHYQCWWIRF
jgi:Domain of unknown function (DUF4124)